MGQQKECLMASEMDLWWGYHLEAHLGVGLEGLLGGYLGLVWAHRLGSLKALELALHWVHNLEDMKVALWALLMVAQRVVLWEYLKVCQMG